MEDLLINLPQYHLDRDTMTKIVYEYFSPDDWFDFIYDFCGSKEQTDNFTGFRYDDEFYIIHRASGMMINWYKNLGRANTCSQKERTEEDYREFFKLLKQEAEIKI